MSKDGERKSGFGNCVYLQFTLFAAPGKMFFVRRERYISSNVRVVLTRNKGGFTNDNTRKN